MEMVQELSNEKPITYLHPDRWFVLIHHTPTVQLSHWCNADGWRCRSIVTCSSQVKSFYKAAPPSCWIIIIQALSSASSRLDSPSFVPTLYDDYYSYDRAQQSYLYSSSAVYINKISSRVELLWSKSTQIISSRTPRTARLIFLDIFIQSDWLIIQKARTMCTMCSQVKRAVGKSILTLIQLEERKKKERKLEASSFLPLFCLVVITITHCYIINSNKINTTFRR